MAARYSINENHGAEPGATDNDPHCHAGCFAPVAPARVVSDLNHSATKMTPEYREQNSWWVRGELIEELAFAHNSVVEMTLPDGKKKEGWIVGALIEMPEVIFTVEACDGSGDFLCPASTLRSIESQAPNQPPEPTAGLAPGRGSS